MKYILFIIFLLLNCASNIEKERLELDKEILEFNKEKLIFEKLRAANSCCSCGCESTELVIMENKKFLPVEQKIDKDCPKIPTPSKEEIWELAREGNWSYSPIFLNLGKVCKDEPKESFYKIYKNSESYVAQTQVPKTKKSSCINNVLFHGKLKLYNLMFEKTIKEIGNSPDDDFTNDLKDVVKYNNEVKGRSFYYDCIPTDPGKSWDTCSCVLYASHEKGKEGLKKRLKK
ncbi:MAG: hypothetical protein KDK36_01635 [Leptospiraceae bacterium]|nr:hypothetical protein [Leptospiraceae bacterium]